MRIPKSGCFVEGCKIMHEHNEDCKWRYDNNVRHSEAGFGDCDCGCHHV